MRRSVLEAVGNTPMVALERLPEEGSAAVLCKLECCNPTGSIKDRIALAMVLDAEESGRLRPGQTLIEATSGNSGISLAMVAAARGYRVVIAMPEGVPPERRRLLIHLGAEILTTSPLDGMAGAFRAVERLVQEDSSYVWIDQFTNPANPKAHRDTTTVEILENTGGSVDAFVAGVGTGGTITGVGGALKEHRRDTLVVAVEPAASPVLSGGEPGDHAIPGLGPDFLPPLLDTSLVDEVIAVSDVEAMAVSARLASEEGLLVGVSSGANVAAALRVASRLGTGRVVVTILPDSGARYV